MPFDNRGNEFNEQWEADHSDAMDAASGRTVGGGNNAGGGIEGMGANLLVFVVIIGPIIASWILGFIWGITFKLKTAGRVIQSVVFALAIGLFILIVSTPMLYTYRDTIVENAMKSPEMAALLAKYDIDINAADFDPEGDWGLDEKQEKEFEAELDVIATKVAYGALYTLLITYLGIASLIALLYFYRLYPTWKLLGAFGFAGMVKKCFSCVWFGGIGNAVLGIIVSKEVGVFCLVIGIALAIFHYIRITLPCAQEAKELRKTMPKAPIAALITVALVWVIPIAVRMSGDAEEKAAQAKHVEGNILLVSHDNAQLYTDRYNLGAKYPEGELTVIPRGTRLTATGAPLKVGGGKSFWLPVEYNGVKGWISHRSALTVKGTATLLEDVELDLGNSGTLFSNSYADYPGVKKKELNIGRDMFNYTFSLKKGETVNIGELNPKTKNRAAYYEVEHNGLFGKIDADKLQVVK